MFVDCIKFLHFIYVCAKRVSISTLHCINVLKVHLSNKQYQNKTNWVEGLFSFLDHEVEQKFRLSFQRILYTFYFVMGPC